MSDSLWFFTEKGMINLGSKPSSLASFVVLTRTESPCNFKEKVTDYDLQQMGYKTPSDLEMDPDYHSKIRIYIRKKYEFKQMQEAC